VIALPALGAGDVYIYAHGNGAIYVGYADGRSLLAPLDEVLAIAEGCHAAGSRVVVAGDHAPMAVDVIDRIRAAAVPVVEFPAGTAPHVWGEGTDALIEAASLGTDALLDDLIARGADVRHRDDSGSTALHHAAAHGSLHAIGALVAAGADPDQRNDRGFTPHMLARACRQDAAADRLRTLGADTRTSAVAGGESVTFHRSHVGTVLVWTLPIVFLAVVVVAFWPLTLLGLVGVLAYAAATALVFPPRPFWAGGVPRRLDGTRLTLFSPSGGSRTIDLADVSVAAIGGSPSRSARLGARWLLLGHPDGAPVGRRSLRRLQLPPGDVELLLGRIDRVVVVSVDGSRRNEVLLPLGAVLSGQGVDLSASLRLQLAEARSES